MARKRAKTDPTDSTIRKLAEIQALLQDLLIIEGARAGISKSDVRRIVGVADVRVSRIWRHLKLKAQD